MPDWKAIVRERLHDLHLQGTAEADLIEEIGEHLRDQYQELLSGGATEEEAYQRTISDLDDVYLLRAGSRRTPQMVRYEPVPRGDARRSNFVEDLWKDLRYAVRTMRKSALFVFFVVLTLALGIGANTTVFTLINTLILNPLPVHKASQLSAVELTKNERTSRSRSGAPLPLSYADLKDYAAKNDVFTSLAGYTSAYPMTLQLHSTSQGFFAELVTANYFSTLGLNAAAGRFFMPDEDTTAGGHPVAVLNYGTWQQRFGGASDIVGKTLRVNNVDLTIIGVAPPRFIGVNALFGPDVWISAAMAEQLFPTQMQHALSDRSKAIFQGFGRVKPFIARAQAQANLATIARDLAREYPATDEGRTTIVRPIREVLFSSSGSNSTPILFASIGLLVVVGLVLLIACSNVANLLLARAASRQQEIAIRLALGASRQRLMRQLLTESVLLGLLSGIAGFFAGYAGLHFLFGTLPQSANFIQPKFDSTVFMFVLAVSLATGFLFGIMPALHASRSTVAEALKEESHTVGKGRRKVTFANSLLVGQVAFSFLLLVTAALFLRGIGRAYAMDPGFQTAHLAVFMTSPGQAGFGKGQTKAFYKDVRDRVSRIPGIESVSWSSNLPLWARTVTGLQIEGRQKRLQADTITTVLNTVASNYFETAGVALQSGREFTDLDQENSAPVAIVNAKLAQDYWPRGDALGKRIRLPGEKQMRQIVGIARTANYTSWGEPPQLCVYVPFEQNYSDAMTLYVRTKGDPQQIIEPVRRELHNAAPQLLASALSSMRTGPQIVDGGLYQAKMGVLLLDIFGMLALGLASVGLYGLLAYSVNQRKREIGLRMALGATQKGVLQLVLREGMSLVMTGVLIGGTAALLVGRLLTRMLYGLPPSDPVSIAGAALVLLSIALLACYLPARRASHLDPLIALRES